MPSLNTAPLPDISALLPLSFMLDALSLSTSAFVSSSSIATLTAETAGDIVFVPDSAPSDEELSSTFSPFFSEQPVSSIEPAIAAHSTAVTIHLNITLLYLFIAATPVVIDGMFSVSLFDLFCLILRTVYNTYRK